MPGNFTFWLKEWKLCLNLYSPPTLRRVDFTEPFKLRQAGGAAIGVAAGLSRHEEARKRRGGSECKSLRSKPDSFFPRPGV